jgi:hypothetical protein
MDASRRIPSFDHTGASLTLGLSYTFPYRSAKIEPVSTISFLMGTGGGWIALGLVVMDR